MFSSDFSAEQAIFATHRGAPSFVTFIFPSQPFFGDYSGREIRWSIENGSQNLELLDEQGEDLFRELKLELNIDELWVSNGAHGDETASIRIKFVQPVTPAELETAKKIFMRVINDDLKFSKLGFDLA